MKTKNLYCVTSYLKSWKPHCFQTKWFFLCSYHIESSFNKNMSLHIEEVLLKIIAETNTSTEGVRRTRYRALVMVGAKIEDVRFGKKMNKIGNLAVMAATDNDITKRFPIARGSWDLQNLKGSGNRVSRHGMSCPPLAKKLLQTAGIEHCLLRVEGNPKHYLFLLHALSKLNANSFWTMGFELSFQT